ncbi:hypothetical protein J1N35_011310 [Gossypium stocksii]|uniref:Uncharacterized protein n=1 Tax=Gossypium stocksii TaxID=47602 RepID=A0A9D3W2I9_9ROSI|nr:hypothetical protein J1N35_011310 [Gossypium stocksii]
MVEKHGWQLLCLHLDDVLTAIVKEFYAHLTSPNNAFIYVHSALVLFDEYSINTQNSLPEGPDEHSQFVKTITTKGLNQVLEDLFMEGTKQTVSLNDCYTINSVSLKPHCKVWLVPVFPTFPKELLSDLEDKDEDEVEATESKTTTHPTIAKKKNKESEWEEEKRELVNIDSDKE